jgi:uncharacterized protein YlxW (UPF0749 family)
VVLVLAFAGLLFATSAQTARIARGGQLRTEESGPFQLLQKAQVVNQQLRDENVALQQQFDKARTAAGKADGRVSGLQKKIDALAALAGTEPKEGKAVIVTLDDAPASVRGSASVAADMLVVHQQDVQAVVNALWLGGAQAIEVMGQRLVATSAVRCVGNVLILQGGVYSPPYVIKAIGDPNRLKSSLDASPEVSIYREYVSRFGLGYGLQTTAKAIVIPGYSGPLTLHYAKLPDPSLPGSGAADGSLPTNSASGAKTPTRTRSANKTAPRTTSKGALGPSTAGTASSSPSSQTAGSMPSSS